MEVIRDAAGNPIRKSRNLAGILAHVRQGGQGNPCNFNLIKMIAVDPIANSGGKLCILFNNGDNYETNFASYDVLRGWVQARRTWYGAPIRVNGVDAGNLRRGMAELT